MPDDLHPADVPPAARGLLDELRGRLADVEHPPRLCRHLLEDAEVIVVCLAHQGRGLLCLGCALDHGAEHGTDCYLCGRDAPTAPYWQVLQATRRRGDEIIGRAAVSVMFAACRICAQSPEPEAA